MIEYSEFDKLHKLIDEHDVISFDAFDTLLLRPWSSPSHLFDYIEHKYKIRGFSNARNNVLVNDVREKSIDDIYDSIGNDYIKYKEIELSEEKNTIYSNPCMKQIYDYAIDKGKIVIIISDIYFHNDFMTDILERCGYVGYHKLYCSCDYQETKCDGDLFDSVIKELNISPNNMLHIGDAHVSDYVVPITKGIDAFRINKNIENYLNYKGYSLSCITDIHDSVITKMCADNFSRCTEFRDDERAWYRFGFDAAGPICYTFAKWINSIVSDGGGAEDIVFVARDGYLLKEIYGQLYPDSKCKLHYIYAPRILSVLLQEQYPRKSDRQDLLDDEKKIIDKVYGLEETPSDERRTFIDKTGNRYKSYLKEEGLGNGAILVVDASSSNLSSQKLLQHYSSGKTMGCYWYLQQSVFSMGYEVVSYQKEHFNVIRSQDLFELIFKSPEPSIKCFSYNKGIEFGDVNEYEKYRIEHFGFLERGVFDFVKSIAEKKLKFFPEADCINKYLNRYCEFPVLEEREYIEYGMASGGIGNTKWTPIQVFNDRNVVKEKVSFFKKLKRILTDHPKLYVFMRKIYHGIRYR